jgi:hypothetical protein
MSAWKVGGPLALTLVMIYTAGLNTGSPDKASANFLVFAFVMGWSALISLLPFWTPVPPPPVNEKQSTGELAEQGLRMGIGTTLALAISYIAGFAKIGWAPSAVGNVVRYDENYRENAPGHGSSAPWAAPQWRRSPWRLSQIRRSLS